MSALNLEDLSTRILSIARALAAGKDDAADALRDLVPADLGDRIASTKDQILIDAAAMSERATQALSEARSTAEKTVAEATGKLDRTLADLASARDHAVAQADRAIATAENALDQAKATGDEATQEAEKTRDAWVASAEQAKQKALDAFEDGRREAQAELDKAKEAAAHVVEDAEEAATKAVEDAKKQVDDAAAQAKKIVDDAASAAAGLPDDVIGLGKDALAKLDAQLSWPSGLLSLIAKVLIWLKQQCFADVDSVQVVWQPPEPGPLGIGLVWQEGADSLRLIYRPAPAAGVDCLVIQSAGAAEHTLAGRGISMTFRGQGDQTVTVGKGLDPGDIGPGGVSLDVTLSAGAFDETFGPLSAAAGAPTLRAVLTHAATWSYEVTVALPRYGGSFAPSTLLAEAGIPVPIDIASIEEFRSLTIGIADGKAIVREGAA